MTSVLRSCMKAISSCPVVTCLGASSLASIGVGSYLGYLAVKAYHVYQECCHGAQTTSCPSITPVSQKDFCDHTKSHGYTYVTVGSIAAGVGFVLFCLASACCCCVRDCIPEKADGEAEKGERVPLTKIKPKNKH